MDTHNFTHHHLLLFLFLLPKSSYVSVVFIYICYFVCSFSTHKTKNGPFCRGYSNEKMKRKERRMAVNTVPKWVETEYSTLFFLLAVNSHYILHAFLSLTLSFCNKICPSFPYCFYGYTEMKLINALIFSYMWCIALEGNTLTSLATQSHKQHSNTYKITLLLHCLLLTAFHHVCFCFYS